jgi:hypothetical protein
VTLRPGEGERVAARRPHRGGAVFLLVADGHRLPATVEVRSSGGRLLRRLRFGSADDLCAGDPRPLTVGYAF